MKRSRDSAAKQNPKNQNHQIKHNNNKWKQVTLMINTNGNKLRHRQMLGELMVATTSSPRPIGINLLPSNQAPDPSPSLHPTTPHLLESHPIPNQKTETKINIQLSKPSKTSKTQKFLVFQEEFEGGKQEGERWQSESKREAQPLELSLSQSLSEAKYMKKKKSRRMESKQDNDTRFYFAF